MDGDLTLNESHAIVAYLANRYSSDNEIYPTDPSIRAKVDQMMYFDTNLLSKTLHDHTWYVVLNDDKKSSS